MSFCFEQVNNAGILLPGTAANSKMEDYDRVMNLNLRYGH